MALEAVKFHLFFKSLCLSNFFLPLLTFKNKRSAVGFSMWKTENTPIFYNSEALHFVKIVMNMSD
jgi:hypothetical protein